MNKKHYEIVEEFNGDLGDICQEIIDLRDQISLTENEKTDLENTNEELEAKVKDLEKQLLTYAIKTLSTEA
jgi:peptidoglycan hydrolase CwlO-like protein